MLSLILKDIPQKSEDSERKLRFVYALSLLQRPSYPAVRWSWAFLKAPKRGRTEGRQR